jgi:hypothetical protein
LSKRIVVMSCKLFLTSFSSTNAIGNLSTFPAEVVLNIFSHLEYFDVKRCLMVCTGFQAYCDHASLDKVMFRYIAPLTARTKFKPKEVKRHYCLDRMSYECSTDINDAYLFGKGSGETESVYSDDGMYRLIKTSAINEYATMPAMRAIKIKIQESQKGIEIKNETGVTVHDVLRALVAYFSVVVPDVMLYDVYPYLATPGPHYHIMENREAIRSDLLGGRTGWTGFHRQSLDKNGVLILIIDGFDS